MYVILAGLQITVIILSQARAAAIAALAGVLIFLWLQYAPNWSRPRRWLSILSTGVVGVSTLLFIGRWAIASGGSIAARWTIWNASLKLLWLRLWLGYGADTVELYFPSVYPPQLVYYQGRGVVVDRAHNWLLDWSLSYGLVATFVLIAVIGFILQAGWQQLVTSPTPSHQRLEPHWIAACMAGVGAQLVGNLFLFEVASTAVVFWLLLAIIVSAAVQETEPQIIGKRPFWQQATGISITLLIVGWLIWFGSVRPLLADRHSWLGTHALNEGNPSAALEEYKAAVQYQPQRNAYQVAFALTAAHLGDFEQAEQSLKQAIRYRPNDYILYTHLAAVYGTQAVANASPQKLQLAYNAYEKALAFAPTIGLTYQQYADLALRSGDETMAVKQAQKAVNLDATDGIAFGILGWAQLYSGNLLAAQNAFEQALTWQPDSADFHLGLATVYFQQNRFDAAKEMVKQSLIRDPTYAPALTLQLQLQDK